MRKLLALIGAAALLAIALGNARHSEAEPASQGTASSTALQTFARQFQPARLSEGGWQIVVPGINYRQFQLLTPNNVFVARMERANTDLTLETSISMGRLASDVQTVRGQANRYDDAINFWGQSYVTPTWGTRSEVIAAINGSYFYFDDGIPWGGMVQSGWYAKRFDECGGSLNGGSGFAWKLNRTAFIGQNVVHLPEKQIVKFLDTNTTMQFQGLNRPREDDELILFTNHYDDDTGTDNSGVEVLVEMARPMMILPPPSTYARGVVREIRDMAGSTNIPFDHIVLSAHGAARTELLAAIQVGDEIGISQEITDYNEGCLQPTGSQWVKTYSSLGGAYIFLHDGQVEAFEDDAGAVVRTPRTAIAFNNDYIYFMVVDGRDPLRSLGMTIEELGIFARDTLSATDAIAQDGGGSSTLVINGQVMNNTFCNIHYCDNYVFLPLIIHTASEEANPAPPQAETAHAPFDEQGVANGIMMVVVKPPEKSAAFSVGQEVAATSNSNLYLGPGTNYAALTSVATGTHGFVVAHAAGLNGIRAKGSYWWKVDFGGGEVGWIQEERLILMATWGPGGAGERSDWEP